MEIWKNIWRCRLGMPKKGTKMTEEQKRKLSESKKIKNKYE